MKSNLHGLNTSDAHTPSLHFAETLRQSLNNNCGRIFGNAKNLWERKFAGREPSDACVHVRISGYSLPSARGHYASLAA